MVGTLLKEYKKHLQSISFIILSSDIRANLPVIIFLGFLEMLVSVCHLALGFMQVVDQEYPVQIVCVSVISSHHRPNRSALFILKTESLAYFNLIRLGSQFQKSQNRVRKLFRNILLRNYPAQKSVRRLQGSRVGFVCMCGCGRAAVLQGLPPVTSGTKSPTVCFLQAGDRPVADESP